MADDASPETAPDADDLELARRLHRVALRLLRRARTDDESFGLSAARLSALSVLVYAGPRRLGELATAEQVKPPTMTRLVQGLEADGLVRRRPDPEDARAARIEVTARGRRLLLAAQQRRVEHLWALLENLSPRQRREVERAVTALLELVQREA